MPKKKQHLLNQYKGSSTSTASAAPKSRRSVNELLATLRVTTAASSPSPASQQDSLATLATNTAPSVPPALRQILQIPETPGPAPRRQARRRFDSNGRRLPPGPPPPPSWTLASRDTKLSQRASHALNASSLAQITLPGAYRPDDGSLMDIVVRRMAARWQDHREYDAVYLYHVPNHIKSALARRVSIEGRPGLTIKDLRMILFGVSDDDDSDAPCEPTSDITTLDVSGAIGKSMTAKELFQFIFPAERQASEPLLESWDSDASADPVPPALLPSLTHLSLALDPQSAQNASWKHLVEFSAKLGSVTHLSLAFWPVPCLTRRSQFASMSSPQRGNIPYGGTNYYSHSLDDDWSEALLILRMLSKSMYALEFLDLTGCSSWAKALISEDKDSHDRVDWAGDWGKITTVRMHAGWDIKTGDPPAKVASYREAYDWGVAVEKRIVAMRQGRGRFITVERSPMAQ